MAIFPGCTGHYAKSLLKAYLGGMTKVSL